MYKFHNVLCRVHMTLKKYIWMHENALIFVNILKFKLIIVLIQVYNNIFVFKINNKIISIIPKIIILDVLSLYQI